VCSATVFTWIPVGFFSKESNRNGIELLVGKLGE
jgi:hypothetical protein